MNALKPDADPEFTLAGRVNDIVQTHPAALGQII